LTQTCERTRALLSVTQAV